MEEKHPIGAFGKDESGRCEAGLAWIPQGTAKVAVVTLDSALDVAIGREVPSVFVAWCGVLLVLWSGVSSLSMVGLFPPPPRRQRGAHLGAGARGGGSWGQQIGCFLLHAGVLRLARQHSPPSSSFWGRRIEFWHQG